MSFAFSQRRHIEQQVRQIAGEQIAKGIKECRGGTDTFDDVVHGLRRRCKRLRGLLRLIEPHFDRFDRENKAFRKAANGLSSTRDAAVMEESWSAVVSFDSKHRSNLAPDLARTVTDALKSRSEAAAQTEPDKLLGAFRELFEAAQDRAQHWQVDGKGFGQLGDGLEKTYRAVRRGLLEAEESQTPEAFHDWRKVVKYHWHHVGLFAPAAPAMLKDRKDALGDLGDLLGDHHNLAVLQETLAEMKAVARGETDDVRGAVAALQQKLGAEAFVLGRQLAAESSSGLRRRFERYWALLPREA